MGMIEGDCYSYMAVGGWLCMVYNKKNELLGSVHVDNSGAWNVKYVGETKYLPINSCLKILGYNKKDEKDMEIE